MQKGSRLTVPQLRRALQDLDDLWRALYVHAVTRALLVQAADTARTHSLRAYDAVHLAGALSFVSSEPLNFACWDKELRDAAQQDGLALLPERL
jgi:predicted nucleic acid-binding protein